MWSGENPHEYYESTLHTEKIGLWCDMSRKRIVSEANFFTSTITGDVYQNIIQLFVSQLEKSMFRSWLQQDNAAHPHVSTNTTSFLHQFFNERLISANLWPPLSPNLSLLDFFYGTTWKIMFTWPPLGSWRTEKQYSTGDWKY